MATNETCGIENPSTRANFPSRMAESLYVNFMDDCLESFLFRVFFPEMFIVYPLGIHRVSLKFLRN